MCWTVCIICMNLSATIHDKTQAIMKNIKEIHEKALVSLHPSFCPPKTSFPRFYLWSNMTSSLKKCHPLKRSWRPYCLTIVFWRENNGKTCNYKINSCLRVFAVRIEARTQGRYQANLQKISLSFTWTMLRSVVSLCCLTQRNISTPSWHRSVWPEHRMAALLAGLQKN